MVIIITKACWGIDLTGAGNWSNRSDGSFHVQRTESVTTMACTVAFSHIQWRGFNSHWKHSWPSLWSTAINQHRLFYNGAGTTINNDWRCTFSIKQMVKLVFPTLWGLCELIHVHISCASRVHMEGWGPLPHMLSGRRWSGVTHCVSWMLLPCWVMWHLGSPAFSLTERCTHHAHKQAHTHIYVAGKHLHTHMWTSRHAHAYKHTHTHKQIISWF